MQIEILKPVFYTIKIMWQKYPMKVAIFLSIFIIQLSIYNRQPTKTDMKIAMSDCFFFVTEPYWIQTHEF